MWNYYGKAHVSLILLKGWAKLYSQQQCMKKPISLILAFYNLVVGIWDQCWKYFDQEGRDDLDELIVPFLPDVASTPGRKHKCPALLRGMSPGQDPADFGGHPANGRLWVQGHIACGCLKLLTLWPDPGVWISTSLSLHSCLSVAEARFPLAAVF